MNDQEEARGEADPGTPEAAARSPRRLLVISILAFAVVSVFGLGGFMFHRANGRVNKVALAMAPKGVTVVEARARAFRTWHRYVGTISPWLEARLGPQFTSAFVREVRVRPGSAVKRGEVVATLDCRNASAQSRAVAMQARAIETKQGAMAHETKRISRLVHGGFVSTNEVEQKTAEAEAKQAELLATQAQLVHTSLEVNDCILRAPFDGEVAERLRDPGAFARPGTALVSMVDRSTVRVTADVPESDFVSVAPGRPVKILMRATGQQMTGTIARRSPAADLSTRTIHFEIDIPDPQRTMPVGTSAELTLSVGEPRPATAIPLNAATIRREKATLFVVRGRTARRLELGVVGEAGSTLFVDPKLEAGSLVVLEGRTALGDGDAVSARRAPPPGANATASRSSDEGRGERP
jgi:membrane fusion protein, multidrug efflux system